MKTHTSKKAILLRTLLLLPLLAVLLYGFSETKIVPKEAALVNEVIQSNEGVESVINFSEQKSATKQELEAYNKLAKKYNKQPKEIRVVPIRDLKILEDIYGKMTSEQKDIVLPFPECPPAQDGASRKLMAEYNKLAKYYNDMPRNKMKILKKDVELLEYIYGLMSDKQKADAEPFPDFPKPPPAPKAPKEAKAIKAPKVKKGEKSNIPPPPPAPNLNDEAFAEKVIDEIIANQDPYDRPNINVKDGADIISFPPPRPPEPQTPLDHVIEMAKKGATFYYEGKKVSSDKAIELVKKNKDLNIQSTGSNSKKPSVKISIAPIYLDKSDAPTSIETGNIEINGKEGFYSTKDGNTSYFNSEGQNVDRGGALLAKNSIKNPKIYFNGKQISSVKANQLLSNNRSIQMASKEYNDGTYAILLTDLNSSSNKNINKNNNPNSAIDLTEMIAKDALFFHNGRPISTEKALWLTQNSLIESVSTVHPKKGKPKVYFLDKV